MCLCRVFLLLVMSAFAGAGCAGARVADVAWDPPDGARQATLREKLRAESPDAELYGYHPLLVVPQDRLVAAFPALDSDDRIIRLCKMTRIGTVAELTPDVTAAERVRTKILRCQDRADQRASACELVSEEAFYAGDPDRYFHVIGDIEPEVAEKIVRLLRSGTVDGGKERIGSGNGDALLSGTWVRTVGREPSAPNRFRLGLSGCGCSPAIIVEVLEGPERLDVIDSQVTCI